MAAQLDQITTKEDHDGLVRRLITRWRDDPGATYRSWFLWDERLKNFRSIRRGITQVVGEIERGSFGVAYRGSSLETVVHSVAEQRQIFKGADHAFLWKPKLRIPDIYESPENQRAFGRLLDACSCCDTAEEIIGHIHAIDRLKIKGLGPAVANLLYFLHPTLVPPFNTAIVKGYNALTGANVKLGSWEHFLAMRTGILDLNDRFRELLSNDLGAIGGLLFDIGSDRYPAPPLDVSGATLASWGQRLEAAREAGLGVKINAVALKGGNEDELGDMLAWCGEQGFDMTIIEVMPMGDIGTENRLDQYLPLSRVRAGLARRFTLTDIPFRTGGPARYVEVGETGRKLGFITPLTHNFCESCNRVRVTCTGQLYMCLGGMALGVALGIACYYRYAAADEVPSDLRPKAISYVLAGGLFAAIIGPEIARRTVGIIPDAIYAGCFFTVAVVQLGSLLVLAGLKIKRPERTASGGRPIGVFLRMPVYIVGVLCCAVGYALMSYLMTATPLQVVNVASQAIGARSTPTSAVLMMFTFIVVIDSDTRHLSCPSSMSVGLTA